MPHIGIHTLDDKSVSGIKLLSVFIHLVAKDTCLHCLGYFRGTGRLCAVANHTRQNRKRVGNSVRNCFHVFTQKKCDACSGTHGIMATMPLYAEYAVHGLSEEKLLRATVLSFLVCMYIKAYSGRLSALCGCAIAGGTGASCGLCFLRGGSEEAICKAVTNMASGLTGMICDGGNQGCVMKGIAACGMAFDCVDLALAGISVDSVHGINGQTPEETMRNIGLIASPGMTQTEKTIVEIQQNKKTKGGLPLLRLPPLSRKNQIFSRSLKAFSAPSVS